MAFPTCDNDCTRSGWVEVMALNGAYDLHLSVAPDTDLEGEVWAFCHDEQEMIRVNGWMFEWEAIDA